MMLPAAMMLGGCEGDLAVPPVPMPDGLRNEAGQIGQGTPDIPLTVYQASIGTLPDGMEKAWVSGYIVGSVNSDIAAFINEETVEWRAPFSKKSNILLAADPECRDLSKVIPVGFTFGYDSRSRLNLADNPNMLGQLVSIYGTTNVKYFGEYGMKNATFYASGDKGFPLDNAKFEKISGDFSEGVYTLYCEGYVAHIMETSPYLYGYVAGINGNSISVEGPQGCFDFFFEDAKDRDPGCFTIRQSDGRYLTRKSTSSLNWAGYDFTDDPSEPGAIWTVQPNEDGTYLIKNVLQGTSMQFDTQYSSFGLYTGSAKAFPYIVKRI